MFVAKASPNAAGPELIQINAGGQPRGEPAGAAGGTRNYDLGQCSGRLPLQNARMWEHVSSAPLDRDLELAVIDNDGLHALVFPCRRIPSGWMKVETKERLDVRPTHWREWQDPKVDRSDPLRSTGKSA